VGLKILFISFAIRFSLILLDAFEMPHWLLLLLLLRFIIGFVLLDRVTIIIFIMRIYDMQYSSDCLVWSIVTISISGFLSSASINCLQMHQVCFEKLHS
jgi:hypothetical protein